MSTEILEIFSTSMKSCLCISHWQGSPHIPAVSILPPACSQVLFQGKNEKKKIIVFKTSKIVASLLRQPSVQFIPWNVRTNCLFNSWRIRNLKVCPLSFKVIKSYSGRNLEPSDAASDLGLCHVVLEDPEDHLGHCCGRYACSCFCSWNWARVVTSFH